MSIVRAATLVYRCLRTCEVSKPPAARISVESPFQELYQNKDSKGAGLHPRGLRVVPQSFGAPYLRSLQGDVGPWDGHIVFLRVPFLGI